MKGYMITQVNFEYDDCWYNENGTTLHKTVYTKREEAEAYCRDVNREWVRQMNRIDSYKEDEYTDYYPCPTMRVYDIIKPAVSREEWDRNPNMPETLSDTLTDQLIALGLPFQVATIEEIEIQ